jgi:hypothetical protein
MNHLEREGILRGARRFIEIYKIYLKNIAHLNLIIFVNLTWAVIRILFLFWLISNINITQLKKSKHIFYGVRGRLFSDSKRGLRKKKVRDPLTLEHTSESYEVIYMCMVLITTLFHHL